MKLLSLIFSIYIFILPCFPCTETDYCDEAVRSSVVMPVGTDSHEDEKEGCEPFCACFCCGHILSSNLQSPGIAIAKPVMKEKFQCFYNNISLPSEFSGNIWQPPKAC